MLGNGQRNILLIAACAAAALCSGLSANARTACTDQELTRLIQPEIDRSKSAVGVCGTGKAARDIANKGLSLINDCPESVEIQAVRSQLQGMLESAKDQIAASCSP